MFVVTIQLRLSCPRLLSVVMVSRMSQSRSLHPFDYAINSCSLAYTASYSFAHLLHILPYAILPCAAHVKSCSSSIFGWRFRNWFNLGFPHSTLFCDSASSSALQRSTAVPRVRSFFRINFYRRKCCECQTRFGPAAWNFLNLRSCMFFSFSCKSQNNCSVGPLCA